MSDVLLIDELAALMRCSVSTIRNRIRAAGETEPWQLPPRLPSVDKRHRWSRAVVTAWLEQNGSTRMRRAS